MNLRRDACKDGQGGEQIDRAANLRHGMAGRLLSWPADEQR